MLAAQSSRLAGCITIKQESQARVDQPPTSECEPELLRPSLTKEECLGFLHQGCHTKELIWRRALAPCYTVPYVTIMLIT